MRSPETHARNFQRTLGMSNKVEVTDSETAQCMDFVRREIARVGRIPPQVLWHYTTGNGLVGIVETDQLWTTQISCVNDSTELRYGVSLLSDALIERQIQSTN